MGKPAIGKETLNVQIDRGLATRIRVTAAKLHVSNSSLVCALILDNIAQYELQAAADEKSTAAGRRNGTLD